MYLDASTPGEQIEDQYDDCDDEQDVDQATTDVEAETQQPKNEENNNDRPKHKVSLQDCAVRLARGTYESSQAFGPRWAVYLRCGVT
jgi:hypothetical protein